MKYCFTVMIIKMCRIQNTIIILYGIQSNILSSRLICRGIVHTSFFSGGATSCDFIEQLSPSTKLGALKRHNFKSLPETYLSASLRATLRGATHRTILPTSRRPYSLGRFSNRLRLFLAVVFALGAQVSRLPLLLLIRVFVRRLSNIFNTDFTIIVFGIWRLGVLDLDALDLQVVLHRAGDVRFGGFLVEGRVEVRLERDRAEVGPVAHHQVGVGLRGAAPRVRRPDGGGVGRLRRQPS